MRTILEKGVGNCKCESHTEGKEAILHIQAECPWNRVLEAKRLEEGGWVTLHRSQEFALRACSVDKINTVPELQFSFAKKKKKVPILSRAVMFMKGECCLSPSMALDTCLEFPTQSPPTPCLIFICHQLLLVESHSVGMSGRENVADCEESWGGERDLGEVEVRRSCWPGISTLKVD